jgi:hypothetical protein
MSRRRVLAWSLVPVLISAAALAVVGVRVAPARADSTTRQIPSSGTASIRGGATGSGAIQSPEFTPAKHFKSDVTRNLPTAQAGTLRTAQAAATDRSLSRSSGLRGHAAAKVAGARLASDPTLNRSFAGLNHRDQRTANGGNQFSLEPPDQGLCVSNGFVVETVNDVLRVFDKQGNPLTGVTALNAFYGYKPAINRATGEFGPFITDPNCLFDKVTQRWFHTVLTLDVDPVSGDFLGPNHLDIAVSKTSDPRGEWVIYVLPVQDDGTQGTPDHNCEGAEPNTEGPCLGDYPQIGADAFGFYITTNEYPFFAATGFHAAQVYAFNKFALAANAANVAVTQFDTIGSVAGNPGFTLRPAVVPSFRYELAQGGTEYFLSSMAAEEANGSGTDNRIAIWSLTKTATLLTSNPQPLLRNSIINVGSYSISPKADQKPGDFPLGQCINDTTLPTPFGPGCWQVLFVEEPAHDEVISHLDASDTRMHQVTFADGKLWSALDTAISVGGATKAGLEFFVVDPNVTGSGVSGSIVKQGYLGVAGNNLTYPTVGVTDGGKAVLSFTLVGADHYPSAAYAGLSAKSGAGAVKVAAEGLGVSDGFTSYKAFVGDPPRTRWGDYGATVADGNTIWIAAEYIGQTCTLTEWFANAGPTLGSCGATRTALANWGTRISNVTP